VTRLTEEQLVTFLVTTAPVLGRDYALVKTGVGTQVKPITDVGKAYIETIKPKLLELSGKNITTPKEEQVNMSTDKQISQEEASALLAAYSVTFKDENGEDTVVTIPRSIPEAVTAIATMDSRGVFAHTEQIKITGYATKDNTLTKVIVSEGSPKEVVDKLIDMVVSPAIVREELHMFLTKLFEFSTLSTLSFVATFNEDTVSVGGDFVINPYRQVNETALHTAVNGLEALLYNVKKELGEDYQGESGIVLPGTEMFKALSK
jgi:hypothetical protein